ncbi:hypothetical protein F4780DRAFT_68148 [Xylariomycetidae sp. FL0641]|nr:hypothetical protein F4780DRAFT_68148 [Xylariomycetidae sp. FL0641]
MTSAAALASLRVGNDICKIQRVHYIVSSAAAQRFVHRILSPVEVAKPRAQRALRPVLDNSPPGPPPPAIEDPYTKPPGPRALEERTAAAQFMAGRFAAKEAVRKAFSARRLRWHDIVLGRPDEADYDAGPDRLEEFFDRGKEAEKPAGEESDKPSGEESDKPSGEEPDKSANEQQQQQPPPPPPLETDSGPLMAYVRGPPGFPHIAAPVSISHDGAYATAVCLGIAEVIPEKRPLPGAAGPVVRRIGTTKPRPRQGGNWYEAPPAGGKRANRPRTRVRYMHGTEPR